LVEDNLVVRQDGSLDRLIKCTAKVKFLLHGWLLLSLSPTYSSEKKEREEVIMADEYLLNIYG